jgi:hypothetical protein
VLVVEVVVQENLVVVEARALEPVLVVEVVVVDQVL